MYRGRAAGHRPRFLRRCAAGDAPAGDRRPGMDETSPGNGRTSVWHDEVADGPSPVPAARIAKSQSGTGIGRAVLQSQTGGQHPGSARPAEGARTLLGLKEMFASLQTTPCPPVGKPPTFDTACFAGTTETAPVTPPA